MSSPCPGTTFDLFSSIAPSDVRFLITERPDNLETLVRQAVGQLEQITRAPSVEHFGETITYVVLWWYFLWWYSCGCTSAVESIGRKRGKEQCWS